MGKVFPVIATRNVQGGNEAKITFAKFILLSVQFLVCIGIGNLPGDPSSFSFAVLMQHFLREDCAQVE